MPVRYLSAREVDQPAQVLRQPPLVYPENPFQWKLRGVVRVRVYISAEGTVDKAEVVYARPLGDFEEAALAATRGLLYAPALKDGRPVRSQKLIEVEFNPDER